MTNYLINYDLRATFTGVYPYRIGEEGTPRKCIYSCARGHSRLHILEECSKCDSPRYFSSDAPRSFTGKVIYLEKYYGSSYGIYPAVACFPDLGPIVLLGTGILNAVILAV